MYQEREMYNIKIKYRTGNSFNTYDEEELIGCSFNQLDCAKKALQSIKEHKEYIDFLEGFDFRRKCKTDEEKRALYDEISSKEWFFKDPEKTKRMQEETNIDFWLHDYDWQHHLMIYINGFGFQKISAFWIGHFETIISAEIITDDKNMKIEF